VTEKFEEFVEGPGVHLVHGLAAPVDAVGDLLFGLEAAFECFEEVDGVFAVVDGVEEAGALVPDFEDLGVEVHLFDEELVVVVAKCEVHLGDGLILGAEEQPEVVPGDVVANL
jgi:hypothetical protein